MSDLTRQSMKVVNYYIEKNGGNYLAGYGNYKTDISRYKRHCEREGIELGPYYLQYLHECEMTWKEMEPKR